jgi:hypothetical protein
MTTPSKQKRARSFVGGPPIPPSTQKTSATADAATKERHSYKPLPKQLRHDGFTYQQIAREREAAIYEQTWTERRSPSIAYEVVRVRRRDGFQIGSRFIPPAEVYPRSERWGQLGWTFCNKSTAFAKLREITATTGGGT